MHASLLSSFARSWFFIPASFGSVAIELFHRFDDFVELRLLKLRVNRQRDHLVCRLLALRERTFGISEICEARLQVQRERIVDRVADSLALQMLLKRVSA